MEAKVDGKWKKSIEKTTGKKADTVKQKVTKETTPKDVKNKKRVSFEISESDKSMTKGKKQPPKRPPTPMRKKTKCMT